jgi:isopentenyl-diphosphate delta-isomerase
MDNVILVDEKDNVVGTMEKMEAHRKGILHRAFSILIFNSKGELLLQKRSAKKYHSGGLWTNACCSHPMPDESLRDATRKRLKHEMGIELQPEFAYKFIYETKLDRNLIEHELDHVFTGVFDGDPAINQEEVEDWKFMSIPLIRHDIKTQPELYSAWFKLIIDHPELKKLATL